MKIIDSKTWAVAAIIRFLTKAVKYSENYTGCLLQNAFNSFSLLHFSSDFAERYIKKIFFKYLALKSAKFYKQLFLCYFYQGLHVISTYQHKNHCFVTETC